MAELKTPNCNYIINQWRRSFPNPPQFHLMVEGVDIPIVSPSFTVFKIDFCPFCGEKLDEHGESKTTSRIRLRCQGNWMPDNVQCLHPADLWADDGTPLCKWCYLDRLYRRISPEELERISILGGLEKHG